MATVIVPGPVVSGMVSGKNAMLAGDAVFVTSGADGCSDRFRSCQPLSATMMPPAMRSAGNVIPKNPSTNLPKK
jgi:hypothetical protein